MILRHRWKTIFRGKVNHLPHIHVEYQGNKAVIGIVSCDVLAGELPRKQLRMVLAWIEIHREELLMDWQLAIAGDEPVKIEPLR